MTKDLARIKKGRFGLQLEGAVCHGGGPGAGPVESGHVASVVRRQQETLVACSLLSVQSRAMVLPVSRLAWHVPPLAQSRSSSDVSRGLCP